jgi:hypothetical protein
VRRLGIRAVSRDQTSVRVKTLVLSVIIVGWVVFIEA